MVHRAVLTMADEYIERRHFQRSWTTLAPTKVAIIWCWLS